MRPVTSRPITSGEDGTLTVMLAGLILAALTTVALSWDVANWLIGNRRLGDLADGAAVAAAGELDYERLRATGGREVTLDTGRAEEVAAAYLTEADGAAARSGLPEAAAEVETGTDAQGRAEVTVRVRAPAEGVFLAMLGLVPPQMHAEATAAVVRVRPE